MSLDIIRRLVGVVILAVGIVLLVFYWNASHSFASNVTKTFTGNPTDHAMWLLIWGIVCVVVGLGVALIPVPALKKR
ncbi:MAG: DUF3185 family protein [Gammaproteobacteria bacterium]